MKIAAKDEYACLAVLDLALNYDPDTPIRVQDIAGRQGIPAKFLFQIMQMLKRVDIVRSRRGTEGGYVLARPPEQITVGDVVKSVNGAETFVQFSRLDSGGREGADPFKPIWADLDRAIGSVLDHVTFADLVRQVRSRERQVMYHI